MRRVALIPARGGSKRLPRKNIIDFMGKPIIAWTIEAAKKTNMFDDIIVSTEDDDIAEISQNYGGSVDIRPEGLATDSASVASVCLDFLAREGSNYDVLCVLYATAPLRTEEDIRQTINLVSPGICGFALAATDYDLPPHQALKYDGQGNVLPMWPDIINKKTDDIERLVVDNGSTYAVHISAFQKEKTFYGPGLKAHIMPRERSQDIDESHDLDLARFFAKKGAE